MHLYQENQSYSYLSDENVPAFSAGNVFAVMDTNCGLCAKGAKWIAKNDTTGAIKFIPMKSELGIALFKHYGIDPDDPASWIYVDAGKAYFSFGAMIKVAQKFGGIWRLLMILNVLPTGIQNRLYSFVARNRYRFFGSTDLCEIADPNIQARIIK